MYKAQNALVIITRNKIVKDPPQRLSHEAQHDITEMPAKHVLDHFQLFGFPKHVISQKRIIARKTYLEITEKVLVAQVVVRLLYSLPLNKF